MSSSLPLQIASRLNRRSKIGPGGLPATFDRTEFRTRGELMPLLARGREMREVNKHA